MADDVNVVDLKEVRSGDVARVGGKNASLGELIAGLQEAGVLVPGGFATTACAYRRFLSANDLTAKINAALQTIDESDIATLNHAGESIRGWIRSTPLPVDLEKDIRAAYAALCAESGGGKDLAVAVRSSATAEDLPDSSFAGQQETYLNISGADAVIDATRRVYASLFTNRAISYRRHRGYADDDVALSVTVQRMVRSDTAAAGVMFTLDTESGFADAIFITAAYGLGENVVQGTVNPDEFYVYKPAHRAGKNAIIRRRLGDKADQMVFSDTPTAEQSVRTIATPPARRQQFCIDDADINTLARYGLAIEEHYGCAMDIEWAKDGEDGRVYIVQARPETVKSNAAADANAHEVIRYQIKSKGAMLAEGRAIGQKIGSGRARVVAGIGEISQVAAGDVLVTDMTDPDWEPVMKQASAIVTRRGGRTCHAAIIARELGVPAVVGCGDSIANISAGELVSVCCAEGDTGFVYAGEVDYAVTKTQLEHAELPVKLQINVANPDGAFDFARLPADGVGLARLEFIIARSVGFHPRCALEFEQLPADVQAQVAGRAHGYASPRECYVGKIAEGVATIAAAFAPHAVIVRLSDFKSNEYAGLIGGTRFEPTEENPMLGFRGAARYVTEQFADCFAMECEAMLRAKRDIGLENIWLMIPFVRTLDEADEVIAVLARNGITREEFKIIMMCEVPSNALLADDFLQRFDGMSIGSNDLTQLTLALDRDSELVAHTFDERNPAVLAMMAQAIAACRRQNKYVGICGQAPSDHPEFAQWLLEQGISAISLNPDSIIDTRTRLAAYLKSQNK